MLRQKHTLQKGGKRFKVKDACGTVLNFKGLAALHQADTLGRRVTFIHSSNAWCYPSMCWVLTARSLCTHGKPPWTHRPESVAHSPWDKKPWDSTGLILDPVPSTVVTVCKWRRKKAVSFMTYKCFCKIWWLFNNYIIQVNCTQCFSGDFTLFSQQYTNIVISNSNVIPNFSLYLILIYIICLMIQMLKVYQFTTLY